MLLALPPSWDISTPHFPLHAALCLAHQLWGWRGWWWCFPSPCASLITKIRVTQWLRHVKVWLLREDALWTHHPWHHQWNAHKEMLLCLTEPGVSPAASSQTSETLGWLCQHSSPGAWIHTRTAKSKLHSQPYSKCCQNIYNLTVLPRELQTNLGPFFLLTSLSSNTSEFSIINLQTLILAVSWTCVSLNRHDLSSSCMEQLTWSPFLTALTAPQDGPWQGINHSQVSVHALERGSKKWFHTSGFPAPVVSSRLDFRVISRIIPTLSVIFTRPEAGHALHKWLCCCFHPP